MALEVREGRHPRTDFLVMDQKAVYGLQGLSSEPFAEDTLGDSIEHALQVRDDYIHLFKPHAAIPCAYTELGTCPKPCSLAEQTAAPSKTLLDCSVWNGIFQSLQLFPH